MPTDTRPSQAPLTGMPEPGVRLPSPDERRRATLFRGANLVDVRGGAIRARTDVLVADGGIERVGQGLAVQGPSVVEVTDRYLLPGLISLHAHPGLMIGLRMDPNGQTPERIVRDLQVWLRHGVTTVQAMGSDRPFAFEVRRAQEQGAFLGARLFSVGHGFGTAGGVPQFHMDPPGPVRVAERAAIVAVLEDLAARGASGVKVWYDDWYGQFPKMAPAVARTIIEESRRLGLTTYAHVYYVDDAKLLVGYGVHVLAHMPRDREVDRELVDLLRSRDVAVIPTLAVPESNVAFADRPAWVDDPLFGRFLPPGSREFVLSEAFVEAVRLKPEFSHLRPDVERATRNTALLGEAGVRLGFGTDAGVSNRVLGFYEHRELELLVAAGLGPAAALRAATVDAARILGQEAVLGEIAPGKRADLVVLRADPLREIANVRTIEAVWVDGVRGCGPLLE